MGVLWFSLALLPMAQAELKLPAVIADHMVLQQKQSNPIWGWDTPGTKITVSFAGKTYAATADNDGKWTVSLDPQAANAPPQSLIVEGSTRREIQDVLIGEVWLCSGQSNMEMGLGLVDNGPEEIAHADYPNIRLLMVPNRWTPQAQDDMEGTWKVCSPKNGCRRRMEWLLGHRLLFWARASHQARRSCRLDRAGLGWNAHRIVDRARRHRSRARAQKGL